MGACVDLWLSVKDLAARTRVMTMVTECVEPLNALECPYESGGPCSAQLRVATQHVYLKLPLADVEQGISHVDSAVLAKHDVMQAHCKAQHKCSRGQQQGPFFLL